jgi:hypothetical protein
MDDLDMLKALGAAHGVQAAQLSASEARKDSSRDRIIAGRSAVPRATSSMPAVWWSTRREVPQVYALRVRHHMDRGFALSAR